MRPRLFQLRTLSPQPVLMSLSCYVALCLLGLLALRSAADNCLFSAKLGPSGGDAHDAIDCGRRACGCPTTPCVFSLHSSGRCVSRPAPNIPLDWIRAPLPWMTQRNGWVSFVSDARPRALWPFNSVYGGSNLGSLGQQFRIDSIKNVVWTDAGPLGVSAGKFARLDDTTNPRIVAQHLGKKLLELAKPFTIMMWVKIDNKEAQMPLLEAYEKNVISFHIWFYPSSTQNQLRLYQSANKNHVVRSTLDNTDRLRWRHLAVIHHNELNYSFYLNGNKWPISFKTIQSTSISISHEVETINVGFRNGGARYFGNMAL